MGKPGDTAHRAPFIETTSPTFIEIIPIKRLHTHTHTHSNLDVFKLRAHPLKAMGIYDLLFKMSKQAAALFRQTEISRNILRILFFLNSLVSSSVKGWQGRVSDGPLQGKVAHNNAFR